MSQNITVVYATDENYLIPTYLSVHSLLRNADKSYVYSICILVSCEVAAQMQEIFKMLEIEFSYAHISFVSLKENTDDFIMSDDEGVKHISNATYFRFFLTDILKQEKKCIYLDADTIVTGNIAKLYCQHMDGCYMAGVLNWFPSDLNERSNRERAKELGIENLNLYVNAGVLVLNLDLMRQHFLTEKLIKEAQSRQYKYNDQDILNKICYPRIKLMGLRNNVLTPYLLNTNTTRKIFYSSNIDEEVAQAIVIHYASKEKPWVCKYYTMAEAWWEECIEIPEYVYRSYVVPFIEDNTLPKKKELVIRLKNCLKKLKRLD